MAKSPKTINDEAVEVLFSYRLPIVRDVLSRLPEPRIPGFRNLDRKRLRRETGDALDGIHPDARIAIRDLTPELDRLQETGTQHILLLRFAGDLREFVKLRDASELKTRLAARGLADRFNASKYLDINHLPEAPVLVDVRHQPARIICKWLERRTWIELVETAPDVLHRQTCETRAVNFFELDLATGTAEVKIQKLRTNALDDRDKKLRQYLTMATEVLDIDGFEHLALSPAIRHLLSDPEIETTRIRVVPDGGGVWEGKEDDVCPVPPDRLRAAIMFEGKWKAPDDRKIRVGFDSRIDELRILSPCLPEQYRALVHAAREWAGEPPVPLPIPEPVEAETEPSPTVSTETESAAQAETERSSSVHEATAPPIDGYEPPPRAPEPIPTTPLEIVDEQPVPGTEPWWRRLRRIVQETKRSRTEEPLAEGEATKSVRELVAVENEKAAAGVGRRARRGATARATWGSREAVERFLTHIRKALYTELKSYRQQLDKLAEDERLVFKLSITSIVIGLAFVLVGSILIGTGLLTFGILSGVVGLVSGTVWALIRQLATQLEARRVQLETKQDERTNLLNAVEASLAAGTWEAMQAVAEKLWEFATAAAPRR